MAWGLRDAGRSVLFIYLFFFFQAEDGIRDLTVTGVQTCALPIYHKLNHDIHLIGMFPCEIFCYQEYIYLAFYSSKSLFRLSTSVGCGTYINLGEDRKSVV